MAKNDFLAVAREIVAGTGAEIGIIPSGRHPKVVVLLGDRTFRHAYPGSPSDWRSIHNWRSQFRRRFRDFVESPRTLAH